MFDSPDLSDGDILLSKDANIGECAMVDGDHWKNHAISGGIVRLRPKIDRFYLFAFLKHLVFREELYSMVPRGATIAHAKTLWLDCKIPLPDQADVERIEKYVSALMEAIVDKECALRGRNEEIRDKIEAELLVGRSKANFSYNYTTSSEIFGRRRFDAAIYGHEYKSKMWMITNYARGCRTPTASGFTIKPGPSLEIKILRTRIDSETPKPGFYTLYIPANISEYGTMNKITWLGTEKNSLFYREVTSCLAKQDSARADRLC